MNQNLDHNEIYCRRLGHHLTFKFCRQENNTRPCPKIRDCWFTCLDVDRFLEEHYKPQEIAYLQNPPAPKITTLMEMVQRIREYPV